MPFRIIEDYNREAEAFERALAGAFPDAQWHVDRYADLARAGVARDEFEMPPVFYVRCQVGQARLVQQISRDLLRYSKEYGATVRNIGDLMTAACARATAPAAKGPPRRPPNESIIG